MHQLIKTGLLSLLILVSEQCRADVTNSLQLVQGTWVYSTMPTILGARSFTKVALNNKNEGWTITFTHTSYPSVNSPDKSPKTQEEGPYPVTAENGVLTIRMPDRVVQYTFVVSPERLIMPAIVEQVPGEWIYISPDGRFSVRCESNPSDIPVGRAQIPGVLGGTGFYSYEEAPRSRLSSDAKYLRFFERTKEGYLSERFRLVFDDHGSPRYERLLSTGERSLDEYQITPYFHQGLGTESGK